MATCKRNKLQQENTKAFLFSYVNKSPDGSFAGLCLLILVFFLDNLFPVTILSLKFEVMLTVSSSEKPIRRLAPPGVQLGGTNASPHTHTHSEELAILMLLSLLLDRDICSENQKRRSVSELLEYQRWTGLQAALVEE